MKHSDLERKDHSNQTRSKEIIFVAAEKPI